jgi:hypothetical protein
MRLNRWRACGLAYRCYSWECRFGKLSGAGSNSRKVPHLHALHPGVTAWDDLAFAERELKRLASVPGGVELLAGREGDPDVVHGDVLAFRRLFTVADDHVLDAEVERDVALWRLDRRPFEWQVVFPSLRTTDARECPTLTATRLVLRPCEPLSRSGASTVSPREAEVKNQPLNGLSSAGRG